MLMASYIEHAVIYYFHSEMRAKSLPRMIFLLIETANIVEIYLNFLIHVEICDHSGVMTLKQNALAVGDELILVLRLQKRASDPIDASIEELARHRHCCQRTMCQLATSDTTTRDDQLAFQDYIQARGRWERKLGCVSRFLSYDWEEISGDQDLDHATNSEEDACLQGRSYPSGAQVWPAPTWLRGVSDAHQPRSKQPMLLSDAWDKGPRRIAAKLFRSDGYGAGIHRSPFLIHSPRQHRRLAWGAWEHIGGGDRHLSGGLGNQDAPLSTWHRTGSSA